MSAWWGWPFASLIASWGWMLLLAAWWMFDDGDPTWPMAVFLGLACVTPLIAACVVSL